MKRKRRVTVTVRNMEAFENVLLNASEFIKGRLFFVSLNTDIRPKSTPSVHYFAVDTELCYDNFYLDFGPLNLAMLYHYCVKLKRKLSSPVFHNKKIVHYTGADSRKRANAAFLIGSYAVINLSYDPEKAFEVLHHDSKREYIDFRDASLGEPYKLSLLECLKAVKKAHTYNFFNFDDFDFIEYEHYECVENGDFNWIVPNKFIAFCGPHNRSKLDKGYPIHSPETYFAYFRRHKVTTIVRLNKKAYDSNKFVQAGFDHKDLYFVDGGTPSDKILQQFINICEASDGAIAVHCKAGLGRTGSLIACYIMKHWKFTAEEAIAWIRICRPGSIIGQQQSWLQEKQKPMWDAGEIYRRKKCITHLTKCQYGIYSLAEMKRKRNQDNVTGIMKKVDCMEIKDPTEELDFEENNRLMTQGDKLNEIKAQRNKVKPLQTTTTERLRRVHIRSSTSTSTNQTLLRGGKLLPNSTTRISGSTSSRVVTKRIVDTKEAPVKRGTRKLPNPIITNGSSDKCQLNEKRQIKNSLTRLNKNGVIYQNGNNVKNNNPEEKSIKRVKRALVSEKDRCASSRSVKVLRRSNVLALSLKEERSEKIELGKIHLPSVKLNKTL